MIFEDNHNWDAYSLANKDILRDVEIKEVKKMMSCCFFIHALYIGIDYIKSVHIYEYMFETADERKLTHMNEPGDTINHMPYKLVSLRISISFHVYQSHIYSLNK